MNIGNRRSWYIDEGEMSMPPWPPQINHYAFYHSPLHPLIAGTSSGIDQYQFDFGFVILASQHAGICICTRGMSILRDVMREHYEGSDARSNTVLVKHAAQ